MLYAIAAQDAERVGVGRCHSYVEARAYSRVIVTPFKQVLTWS